VCFGEVVFHSEFHVFFLCMLFLYDVLKSLVATTFHIPSVLVLEHKKRRCAHGGRCVCKTEVFRCCDEMARDGQ
jgi:hypothetical protein